MWNLVSSELVEYQNKANYVFGALIVNRNPTVSFLQYQVHQIPVTLEVENLQIVCNGSFTIIQWHLLMHISPIKFSINVDSKSFWDRRHSILRCFLRKFKSPCNDSGLIVCKLSSLSCLFTCPCANGLHTSPLMNFCSWRKEDQHIPHSHVSQREFSVQLDEIVLCVPSPVNSLTAKGNRRFRVVKCSFPDLLKYWLVNTEKTHL